MKNQLACPKCDSRKLWLIERVYTSREHTERVDQPPPRAIDWTGLQMPKSLASVSFDSYVCADCGYSELWSRGCETLRHNPAIGIHYLDNTPERGAYR